MSESFLMYCVNCRKQNIVFEDDPPDVKCEFGNHSVRIKQEGKMVAKINEKDLYPETRQQLGIEEKPETGVLSPVPPKPDLAGLNRFAARIALSKYYKAHDVEMLADYNRLGDRPAKERWGCSEFFWAKFWKAHNLPIGAAHGRGIKRIKKARAAAKGDRAVPPAGKDEPGTVFCPTKLCKKCELFIEYRGYRAAVQDMRR